MNKPSRRKTIRRKIREVGPKSTANPKATLSEIERQYTKKRTMPQQKYNRKVKNKVQLINRKKRN